MTKHKKQQTHTLQMDAANTEDRSLKPMSPWPTDLART